MQGVVILEAVISADGRVDNVKVLRGMPLLNDAAVAAVQQWGYTPTTLNGTAGAGGHDRDRELPPRRLIAGVGARDAPPGVRGRFLL